MQLITREGMESQATDGRVTPGSVMLPGLLMRSEVQGLVAAAVADTMSAYLQGFGRLSLTYRNLREVDFSESLAVMSARDFADSQSSHGHAVIIQQPLPVAVDQLVEALYPALGPLLPRLALIHIKLAKVAVRLLPASASAEHPALHISRFAFSVLLLMCKIACTASPSQQIQLVLAA